VTIPTSGDAPAPARLLALRLQGFKSFAERTLVEFGPGISAVVGPNGSGKSNLADALRWALGEQGRALRSRRSEDVIFAGSERRSALGMADVTLVLDNADALLPVDYSVLEIGRRLYRSGENDYLLNKQRIRLRDLVDLLDAAHLADNAFLFIGQGMVDQALALRPEERRPLFEEVAGVRRHERRRRRAEEQLVEAEANLARVEDILAELRPQARRLAAQAEQQASRTSAGEELAAALLRAGHSRWHEVANRAADASGRLSAARTSVDAAFAGLQESERVATAITAELAARADLEIERRAAHESARDALTAGRLRQARLGGDRDAIARDRGRLEDERAVAETDLAVRRRELAEPVPQRDADLEAALAVHERALAQALEELGAIRAQDAARGDELAALRRAEAARHSEEETARRRLADAERRLGDEQPGARGAGARRAELEALARDASAALGSASVAERSAADARAAARAALDEIEGRLAAASERATAAGSRAATLRGRLEALRGRLAEDETRGIARAARRRGGRRLDEDLQVDPEARAAVEAALGEAARAYLVPAASVAELATERGTLIVARTDQGIDAAIREMPESLRGRIAALGGGILADAIRRDPSGAASRLLATAVWVPDLAAALELQPHLPPGWVAVARDGTVVAGSVTVSLGRADGLLERRVDVERLAAEVEAATAEADAAAADAAALGIEAATARDALDAARSLESTASSARRQAEDADRAAGRAWEATAREAAWHEAQVTRLELEVARGREAVARFEVATADRARPTETSGGGADNGRAVAVWDARVTDLRQRRDRMAHDLAEQDSARRDAEARRARADAAIALDEERIARAMRETVSLGERERELEQEGESLGSELAAAAAREEHARRLLDELWAADAVDRDRLAAAEAGAAAARDRLRVAEDRFRSAEVADLEARLGLDAIREQILVELAGLGELGLRSLGVADVGDDESAALEAALAARSIEWAATPPAAEVPLPGRLAYLRRRYHDLGAANPFAVDEYAALRVRLETLEGQHADLRAAIGRTRDLIEELNALIADQFQTTFRALETAFDSRFQQLFGGGFARLSLTDPADLSATGVEIVARPPGKKAQALAMLSGGERALTAVALLFAMLEVRPVPFCVLDEVDAALDEANVGRFSEALRGLAHQTQFIVITHNRGTIEIADALYGVTVGDDSVSRVISLRLEEAREIAQRRGDQPADLLAG
jgi:chromosome segregation protein